MDPAISAAPLAPDQMILLPSQDTARLTATATRLHEQGLPLPQTLDSPLFRTCLDQTPRTVRHALDAFLHHAGGFILLRGFAFGDLPPTPRTHPAGLPGTHPTSFLGALIAEHLGVMYGYQDEQEGALVQDIYPIPADRDQPRGSGAQLFDLHTENAHHDIRPHHIGLLCLRADPTRTAATTLAPIDQILKRLSDQDQVLLNQPLFISRAPLSFRRTATGTRAESSPHPIIDHDPHGTITIRCNANTGSTRATVPSAQRALDRFTTHAHAVQQHVPTRAGDILLINNQRVLHGRTPYTPSYNGTDRWLRRFYTTARPVGPAIDPDRTVARSPH